MVMKGGRVIETGLTDQVLDDPREPYTQLLVSSILPRMSAPMTAMIDIADANKTFTMHLQGGIELPVVRGVTFHVEPGECVVLAGPSGAGKSSILKMIFGNYRCDGGRIGIRHRGEVIDLATAEPRQVLSVRRATIGYVSQFLRAVPRVATIDVVAEPLIVNGMARADAQAQRPANCCTGSTFPSGSGSCRPRPSPAASSSASTSRAASSRICRSCCSTSRPPRSMPPTAPSWSS